MLSLIEIIHADSANVERTTSERPLDATTALLVVRLWKALVDRIQVVRSDTVAFDGTPYYFWCAGLAGATVSPRSSSVLGNAIEISGDLARFIKDPRSTDLAIIRSELSEAILRAQKHEPCVRAVHP